MGWGHPRHHEASQGRRDVCKSTLETITMRVIIAASPTAVSQEPAATSCQGMALVIALVTDLPTAQTPHAAALSCEGKKQRGLGQVCHPLVLSCR